MTPGRREPFLFILVFLPRRNKLQGHYFNKAVVILERGLLKIRPSTARHRAAKSCLVPNSLAPEELGIGRVFLLFSVGICTFLGAQKEGEFRQHLGRGPLAQGVTWMKFALVDSEMG